MADDDRLKSTTRWSLPPDVPRVLRPRPAPAATVAEACARLDADPDLMAVPLASGGLVCRGF